MSYLKISSVGTMEPEALSLIGASTKRGDGSSIGMFGSGLKYSIATMIRQKINFKIFSGVQEMIIGTKAVKFRDQDFNAITVNGKETSLTDSMGTEDWTGAWPFIREIYSNALDEGSASINVVEEIIPEEGTTIFYFEVNEKIQDIITNFEKYFVTKSKYLYTDGKGNYIHPSIGHTKIFRKGITVYERTHTKALFSYDIDDIDINESRVIKYTWKWAEKVARMIEECTDDLILTTFFNGIANSNAGYAEHDCYLSEHTDTVTSKAYRDYISKGKFYPVEIDFLVQPKDKTGRLALPIKFLKRFIKAVPDADILGMTVDMNGDSNTDAMYLVCEMTTTMQDKIDRAVALLNSTMYGIRLTYPIKVCNFKGENILGRFHNDTILLASKLDAKPIEVIATIIIEEQEHGTSGFRDKTRNFQNHLFDLLMSAYIETSMIKGLREKVVNSEQKLNKIPKWIRNIFIKDAN